ncbi:hypothetical protein [Actinopolyspora sp. BKK1]|uniref:hypothetical protein n=1 Tax=Actinopolyspora sp. BKK1 TaxID=2599394 RepID=UPI0003A8E0E7|nr:hypothetical protein [Actinopolyspora sp. BKK1]
MSSKVATGKIAEAHGSGPTHTDALNLKLARKVSPEDLAVIVQRVAQDTNGDRGQLGDAAGLTRNE